MCTHYILKFSSFGVAELQMQISEFALLSQPRQQIQLCRHNRGEQRAVERGAGTYAVMPKLASKNYCQNCLAINSDKYQSVTPPVRGNTSMPKQKAPNPNEHLCKVSATCHSSSSSNNGAHASSNIKGAWPLYDLTVNANSANCRLPKCWMAN